MSDFQEECRVRVLAVVRSVCEMQPLEPFDDLSRGQREAYIKAVDEIMGILGEWGSFCAAVDAESAGYGR